MPLMRIDVRKGHDETYLKKLLDIAYEVQLETFHTPLGDRYQLLTQHEPFEMQILDTGLGISRTKDVVVFHLTTRPRTSESKELFYKTLVTRLHNELGILQTDVVISLSVNTDEDWSFGNGEAQFLTGQL
ncbi:MAG: tautomerase family protein [Enterococcus sp.]